MKKNVRVNNSIFKLYQDGFKWQNKNTSIYWLSFFLHTWPEKQFLIVLTIFCILVYHTKLLNFQKIQVAGRTDKNLIKAFDGVSTRLFAAHSYCFRRPYKQILGGKGFDPRPSKQAWKYSVLMNFKSNRKSLIKAFIGWYAHTVQFVQ